MIWILFKIRLKSIFSANSAKRAVAGVGRGRRVAMLFLFGFLAVYMFGLFGFLFYNLSTLLSTSTAWIYYAFAAFMSIALTFIGSIFTIQSQVFDAKDNELLLSMPIRPRDIMLSRLLAIIALNYGYSLLVMLPAFFISCLTTPLSLIGAVNFWLGNLFLPIFTMAVGCFVAWLVALLTSRMKHKNLFTSAVMIIFFCAYMYFCMNLSSLIVNISESVNSLGNLIGSFANPASFFAYAVASPNGLGSMLLNLLWLILSAVIPITVALLLLGKFFIGIATTKRGVNIKYVRKELKTSRVNFAMLKKELSFFFGLPMYVLNSGIGAVIAVILGAAVIIKRDDINILLLMDELSFIHDLLPILICLIIGMLSAMTNTTAPSVSLEGKTFWILKSSPIKTTNVFFGKIGTNLVIAFPAVLFASLACSFSLDFSPSEILFLTVTTLVIQFFFAVFGLYINLLIPKFDWVSETIAIKQSLSVVIAMLGGFLWICIPVFLYLLIPGLAALSAGVLMLLCFIFFAILAAAASLLLYTNGVRRFEHLQN